MIDICSLLTSDSRFSRSGTQLQQASINLVDIIQSSSVRKCLDESIDSSKRLIHLLNMLLYANKHGDSLVSFKFTTSNVVEYLMNGEFSIFDYSDIFDFEVKQDLKQDFVEYKDVSFQFDSNSPNTSQFLSQFLHSNNQVNTKNSSKNSNDERILETSDYWIQSVRLDFPTIPQPDVKNKVHHEIYGNYEYCVYGESNIPWNQSQITALTNVNEFSDDDILNLFPKVRLYTRSQYMYQEYENLDYDDNLGVIFNISGYTTDQIKQNIIEYPHLDLLDREVKIKGKTTTLPFWKHIEIDGEILSTISVWDSLDDTKVLPKTESFMNEYVVRKYILDRTVKGYEHIYPMRGTLLPFLTLIAPPEFYVSLGYDPLEIGRKCVIARQSFKFSRNPILKILGNRDNDVKLPLQ